MTSLCHCEQPVLLPQIRDNHFRPQDASLKEGDPWCSCDKSSLRCSNPDMQADPAVTDIRGAGPIARRTHKASATSIRTLASSLETNPSSYWKAQRRIGPRAFTAHVHRTHLQTFSSILPIRTPCRAHQHCEPYNRHSRESRHRANTFRTQIRETPRWIRTVPSTNRPLAITSIKQIKRTQKKSTPRFTKHDQSSVS